MRAPCLRFGTHSVAALAKASTSIRVGHLGSDRALLPFDLLGDLAGGDPHDESIIYRIAKLMRGDFNSRKTFFNRLSKADDAIVRLIRHQFGLKGRIRIHDVGASNAITSVALFQRLRALANVSLTASDLHKEIFVVRLPNSDWRVIFDDAGEWMQAICGRLVICRQMRSDEWSPVNALLAVLAAHSVVHRAAVHLRDHPNEVKLVPLFHPVARSLAIEESPRFTLAKADILNLPEKSWEIVRAMNVLIGLPHVKRHLALRSLCGSLVDGGLLVLGYGGKRCSIFVRQGDRMSLIEDVGKTVGEKSEVLGLRLRAWDCPNASRRFASHSQDEPRLAICGHAAPRPFIAGPIGAVAGGAAGAATGAALSAPREEQLR